MQTNLLEINQLEVGFKLQIQAQDSIHADYVIIASGGSPSINSYQWIKNLGHTIHSPIPSLFTFNDQSKHFSDLMGLSVPVAEVKLVGTKFAQTGSLLITHWGLSGPAIIKLSAWAATYLHEKKYEFTALVSWIGAAKEEPTKQEIQSYIKSNPKQTVFKNPMFEIPQRLWIKLCDRSEILETKIYGELSHKQINKLVENLIRCPFHIKGKTTFKEEFVTCGGVELSEIELSSMESKKIKGLYFAGEVLNIDGVTGGFNFQSAWTTAWIAAKSVCNKA